MNKLLELQLSVWKLTGTINRLQSVETRSTDEDTELTTATTEYADANAQLVAEGERERTRLEAARLVHTTDPAVREQRALCGRANVGEISQRSWNGDLWTGRTWKYSRRLAVVRTKSRSTCSDSNSARSPPRSATWRPRKRTSWPRFSPRVRGRFCL